MDVMEYETKMQQYNQQIVECEVKMRQIKEEIQEAEDAYDNMQCYIKEFYMFMDESVTLNKNFLECSLLKSISGLVNGISEMLHGREFQIAENNIAEINRQIKVEVTRLYNEYENYERLRNSLISERNILETNQPTQIEL